MIPIAEHDSWLSLDTMWGCPNSCGYCFLRNAGLAGIAPKICFPLDNSLRNKIVSVLHDCPQDVPICIGNYTDMLANEDMRNRLYETARFISCIDPLRLIVIISKSKISKTIAQNISEATAGRGLIILSQSFSKDYNVTIEKGSISSPDETYQSLEVISSTEGLEAAHFWRPFLFKWNSTKDISDRIHKLKNSGCNCSIVIGLKGDMHMIRSYSNEFCSCANSEIALDGVHGDERIIEELLNDLLNTAKECDYPVYRHTSCAVALIQNSPDINGTSKSSFKTANCDKVSCPKQQRIICDNDPLLNDNEMPIFDEINEFEYTHFVHIYHRSPLAKKVYLQKVWKGNIISEVKNGYI